MPLQRQRKVPGPPDRTWNLRLLAISCHTRSLHDDVSQRHVLASRPCRAGPELAAPITLGDNVWLGGGVIVCPGVTIGANTTIGAGSVVTRDIPANVFAVGNPCRVIRTLE